MEHSKNIQSFLNKTKFYSFFFSILNSRTRRKPFGISILDYIESCISTSYWQVTSSDRTFCSHSDWIYISYASHCYWISSSVSFRPSHTMYKMYIFFFKSLPAFPSRILRVSFSGFFLWFSAHELLLYVTSVQRLMTSRPERERFYMRFQLEVIYQSWRHFRIFSRQRPLH